MILQMPFLYALIAMQKYVSMIRSIPKEHVSRKKSLSNTGIIGISRSKMGLKKRRKQINSCFSR